jgi:hypothetical protein
LCDSDHELGSIVAWGDKNVGGIFPYEGLYNSSKYYIGEKCKKKNMKILIKTYDVQSLLSADSGT